MTNHSISRFSSAGVQKGVFAFGVALCTMGMGLSGNAQHITTFDVPGAGTGAYQGTYAENINQRGVITGFYVDANFVFHGYLRSPDGKFTTFDVPGATAGEGTFPYGLNAEGATVGYWNDVNDAFHAFLRKPDGTIVSFTDPNECTGADYQGCQGTGFFGINASGAIAGGYLDANFVQHALLVGSDGKVTSFEAPGAGTTPDSNPTNYTFQGTSPTGGDGLNQQGAITGSYVDTSFVSHGFLRGPYGTFTDFDAPGADTTGAGYGTFPQGLNNSAAITGEYLDANAVYHGFLRSPDGTFATFDAPGAGTATGEYLGTVPESLNDSGVIAGVYYDNNNGNHGFVRDSNGKITTFDVLEAGPYYGTIPQSINPSGAITGYYVDANNVYHGFLRIPD
jgi:hypothetical protein